MNYRSILLCVTAAIALVSCASPEHQDLLDNRYETLNLIPMYGSPREKTDEQKKADEVFIKTVVADSGSREKASKKFAAEAWREKQKGNVPDAMRRFNQAWLLNPNYYQPYWGFGALLLAEGKPAVAVTHFEKALALIDDEKEKPRLLTDTAKAYTRLGGVVTTTTDQAQSEKFFAKANSLFEEALILDPQYGNAYRAWAISLYNQGNYEKAWTMVKKLRGLGGPDFDPNFIDALSREMPEPK